MKILTPTGHYKTLNNLHAKQQQKPLTSFPLPDISGQTHISLYDKNVHEHYAEFINSVSKYFGLGLLLSYIPFSKAFKTRLKFARAIKYYQQELYHNMQYPGFENAEAEIEPDFELTKDKIWLHHVLPTPDLFLA